MISVKAFEANQFCLIAEINTFLKWYLREEQHLVSGVTQDRALSSKIKRQSLEQMFYCMAWSFLAEMRSYGTERTLVTES